MVNRYRQGRMDVNLLEQLALQVPPAGIELSGLLSGHDPNSNGYLQMHVLHLLAAGRLSFEPPSYGVIMEALRHAILPKTYPAWSSGTVQTLTNRAVRLLKHCGVELIVMDEFHHLFDMDRAKVMTKASQ